MPDAPQQPDPARPLRRWTMRCVAAGRLAGALAALVALHALAYLLITGQTLPISWLLQIALAAFAVAAGAFACLHQYLRWNRPARRLMIAVQKVRDGQVPIDALSEIRGGVAPLAALAQSLLRDLRSQQAAFAQLEMELSQRVARRTEALERKLGTLMQQASRDPITGVFNRRLLDQHLPRMVNEARTDQAPLALLMIDIDHFKGVNDTLGHAAGDQLLADVGQLIRSSLRDTDLAFRYGGDEFVIVLPGQTADRAQALGERLMSLMDHLAGPLRLDTPPALSVGIATLDDLPDPTADTLLALADQRLYHNKHARRSAA